MTLPSLLTVPVFVLHLAACPDRILIVLVETRAAKADN
jgi:hypothetical protein